MNTNAPVPAGDPGIEVIEEAIRAAEAKTSGRFVCLCPGTYADPGRPPTEFVRLEMNRTPLRNGVLLYFAPESQAFALACDEGIQFQCGPNSKISVTAVAVTRLKGSLADALVGDIQSAGDLLAQPFPRHSLDRMIPNTVIRD